MYKLLADVDVPQKMLGFGDNIVVELNEVTAELRISVFGDCHFKDEAILDLRELFKED